MLGNLRTEAVGAKVVCLLCLGWRKSYYGVYGDNEFARRRGPVATHTLVMLHKGVWLRVEWVWPRRHGPSLASHPRPSSSGLGGKNLRDAFSRVSVFVSWGWSHLTSLFANASKEQMVTCFDMLLPRLVV